MSTETLNLGNLTPMDESPVDEVVPTEVLASPAETVTPQPEVVIEPAKSSRHWRRAERPVTTINGSNAEMSLPEDVPEQAAEVKVQLSNEERIAALMPRMAESIDDVEREVVPQSVEEARKIIDDMKNVVKITQETFKVDPSLQKHANRETLDDFAATADKGLDNWRLTDHERAQWAEVNGLTGPSRLSAAWRNLMNSLSPEGSNETDQQKFARLKKQAHDRLRLDEAIVKETAAAEPTKTPEVDEPAVKPQDELAPKYTRAMWEKMNKSERARAHQDMDRRQKLWLEQQRPEDIPTEAWAHLSDAVKNRIVDQVATEAETADWVEANQPKMIADPVWKKMSPELKRELVDGMFDRAAAENEAWEARRPEDIPAEAWARVSHQGKIQVLHQIENETSLDDRRPRDIKPKAWAQISTEGKRRILDQIEAEEQAAQAAKAEQKTKASLWQRLRGKVAERLRATTSVNKDGVREVSIRKRTVAAILGAALAVGAVVTASNELSDNTSSAQTTAVSESGSRNALAESDPRAESVKQMQTLGRKAVHKVVAAPAEVTLKKGDTIWHEAEVQLKKQGNNHPTNAQIDRLSDHLRSINGHMSEAQARELPVGYHLKLDK